MTSSSDYTGLRLDAQALRVLAHPLRSRLLSRLRMAGPATATELAAALSTNTGATSYHLRKLADVGLVTDTGEGEGKRRPWRATTAYHSFTPSEFRDDDDAAAAVGWLQREYVHQLAGRAIRWLDLAGSWPAEWADQLGLDDTYVLVDPDQLRRLRSELEALFERYRAPDTDHPAALRQAQGAIRVQVHTVLHPLDLDAVPPTPPAEQGATEGPG